MKFDIRTILVVFVIGLLLLMGFPEPGARPVIGAEKSAISYAKDVQPILSANCYGCHNSKKKKAGGDLQSGFVGVQKIVAPMKPDDSRLFKMPCRQRRKADAAEESSASRANQTDQDLDR